MSVEVSDLPTRVQVSVVDVDTHPSVSPALIAEHVPEPYRSLYFSNRAGESEVAAALYRPPQTRRVDAAPPDGRLPGEVPAFMDRQLLRDAGVDYAMLLCLQPAPKIANPQLETAVFAGLNSALAATWLGADNRHGRYFGAIRVSPYDPEGASREIERWAGHPAFRTVFLVPEASAPFGRPEFRSVLAAAARHRLPISLHVNKAPSTRVMTPAGFPAYHLETLTEWPVYYMSHIASLIFEGAFEDLPDLKFAFVEGGFSWAPTFMWRLDRMWEALRGEIPNVRRRPSEYVEAHMRFSTQPFDEASSRDLGHVMDWMDASRLLMFSSDYPHYDYDDPAWVRQRLAPGHRGPVMGANAVDMFGLPATRPVDALDLARQTGVG